MPDPAPSASDSRGSPRESGSLAPASSGFAPVDRRAWLRAGGLILALLIVPIAAWIILGGKPDLPPVARPTTNRNLTAAPGDSGDSDTASNPKDGRTLGGKVVDESNKPLANATVTFLPPGTTTSRFTARTDEEGAFTIEGIGAVNGTLSARLEGYAGPPVQLNASSDVSNIVLHLHQAQGVKGQVVDGEGKPVDHASVVCDGGKAQAFSQPDGSFVLAIDDDGCTATASHPDFGSSDPTKMHGGSRNIIALPSPGGISGSVVDDQGKPITSYVIAIESFVPTDKNAPNKNGASSLPINDPQGEFEFKTLSRGRYVLSVSTRNHPPTMSDAIDVDSGRVARNIRITVGKGIPLSGTVTDRATQKPLAGVRLSLDSMVSGPSGIAPVVTDESGSYTLEGVPNGPFSVKFSMAGYAERIVSLDGRGKSEMHADVDLNPGNPGSTEMIGVGATLGQGSGGILITSVMDGGPAEQAGVKANDKIVRVDGDDATSFSVSECIQRLRGGEGTSLNLTVERDGARLDFRITRARILR